MLRFTETYEALSSKEEKTDFFLKMVDIMHSRKEVSFDPSGVPASERCSFRPRYEQFADSMKKWATPMTNATTSEQHGS